MMTRIFRWVVPLLCFCSVVSATYAQVAMAPLSQVDIPIAVDLKPLYAFANKVIDSIYTSPDYPKGWIEDGCEKRYQYRFVRGPMKFMAVNDVLVVKFTGTYLVRGSTRVCTGLGKTPWTPPCSCGTGSEAPRRVDAGFAATLRVLPDFSFDIQLQATKPRPLDKCVVCAFGIDITQTVVDQVASELEQSLKETSAMLKAISLRPYVQQLWDSLQTGYPVPGFGRLVMQPEAMRMSRIQLRRDSMFVSIGLTARPELSPVAVATHKPLPALSDFAYRSGFSIHVAQVLPYDSLDAMINQSIRGKEIVMGKGLLSKTIVLDSAHLFPVESGVRIQVYASKGIQGIFSLMGKPAWDSAQHRLYVDALDYELALDSRFLQNVSTLFDKTILRKLQEYTTIDLREKTDSLKASLNSMMNSELYEGVQARGGVQHLVLSELTAMSSGIYLSGYCEGRLALQVNVEPFLKLMANQ